MDQHGNGARTEKPDGGVAAPCALGKVRLPHRDLDTAVRASGVLSGVLTSRSALCRAGVIDGRSGQTAFDRQISADTERPLLTRSARFTLGHTIVVGMARRQQPPERKPFDRPQDLGDERGRFFGQRVGLEPEMQSEVTRGGGGKAVNASPNNRVTSAALSVLTGPGGRSAVTRVAARGAASSADPTRWRREPVRLCRFQGPAATRSTSSASDASGARHVWDRTRPPGPRRSSAKAPMVSRPTCSSFRLRLRLDADGEGRTPYADDRGGVSRRMESGASFRHAARHVRRHTANDFRTIPKPPSPGAYT